MPLTVEPAITPEVMGATDQPTIPIDDELELRPFVPTDAAAVMRAFTDPEIRYWHAFRVDTDDEALEWIDRTHELWRDSKSAVFAIADRSDAVHGRCALHVEARQGIAEIAYWVLPESRGQGVAVRAAIAATAWGHERLGIHRILLQHSTRNPASCSVARRAGYEVEGTARQQDLLVDGRHDMHQHAHLAGDRPRG